MIAAPAPRGIHEPHGLASRPSLGTLWEVVAEVPDPEVPVVSVVELGILRGIEWDPADSSTLVVTVTPTYSGCPATEVIMASIRYALFAAGVTRLRIETRLFPAWTTDWMTPDAKRKLRDYGIAPPDGTRSVSTTTLIDVTGISPLRRAHFDIDCIAV